MFVCFHDSSVQWTTYLRSFDEDEEEEDFAAAKQSKAIDAAGSKRSKDLIQKRNSVKDTLQCNSSILVYWWRETEIGYHHHH